MISYTLIRSRRKTIAIYITATAEIEVRAPLKAPKADIERFVASKEAWILSHLALRQRRRDEKRTFTLNYGYMLPLCGGSYPICAGNDGRASFDGECFRLPSGLSPLQIKSAVVLIYKAEAKRILALKTAEYAERMNVRFTSVKVSGAKTRWGSCSGKNGISYSWRLIMADEDAVDYVVVHELAHTNEHNHSPRFWAVVESVLPDYKPHKRKLKTLQDRLSQEDWD